MRQNIVTSDDMHKVYCTNHKNQAAAVRWQLGAAVDCTRFLCGSVAPCSNALHNESVEIDNGQCNHHTCVC